MSVKFTDFVPQALISVIGKHKYNKSAVKHVIKSISRYVGQIICICNNKQKWNQPDICIREANINTLQNTLNQQEYKMRTTRKATKRNLQKYVIPKELRTLLIVDASDITREFMHSSAMMDICSNNRIYGFDILMLVQYPGQIPDAIRTQMNYVGVLHTSFDMLIFNDYAGLMRTRFGKLIFDEYVAKSICSYIDWKNTIQGYIDDRATLCIIDNINACLFSISLEDE